MSSKTLIRLRVRSSSFGLKGESWEGLCSKFTHEKFGQGDLMNVIYRVATYLQSIAQALRASMKQTVLRLRDEILRPPFYS